MSSETVEILTISGVTDRRALLARLCGELGRALAGDGGWERDDTLVPWHASAATFEELPARVMDAIIDELAETGDCLGAIEFSGYIETDHGPRAWGNVTVHGSRPRVQVPEIEACIVEAAEDGFRVEARLRLRREDSSDA